MPLYSQDFKQRQGEEWSLEGLKRLGRENLRKFHREEYQELLSSGKLEEYLQESAQRTLNAMNSLKEKLVSQGDTQDQAERTAWELVREEWILRPPD